MADYKYTAETEPYPAPGRHTHIGKARISYGAKPRAVDPFAYGRTTGTANAQQGGTIPTVDANGSTMGALPDAFDGDFSIGENKNVSTPVSGS